MDSWPVLVAAILGSGGGAWAAVWVAVGYLKEGITEAKEDAARAHDHAEKAHDRINDFLLIGSK